MALCDDPSAVSVGQDWAAVRARGRVPIFATANDLTCLYAVRLAPRHPLAHTCAAAVLLDDVMVNE